MRYEHLHPRAALPALILLAILVTSPRDAGALNPNHDCAFCHGIHGGGLIVSGDVNVENLCLGCHDGTVSDLRAAIHVNDNNSNYAPFRVTCLRCHNPHDSDPGRSGAAPNWLGPHADSASPGVGVCNVSKEPCSTLAECRPEDNECIPWKEGVNIKLVGGELTARIRTWELDSNNDGVADVGPQCEPGQDFTGIADNACYVEGARDVVFEQRGKDRRSDPDELGRHSFADEDLDANGVFDGPCEVCHTRAAHHRNDGSEPSPGHNTGRACTDCHRHVDGFMP